MKVTFQSGAVTLTVDLQNENSGAFQMDEKNVAQFEATVRGIIAILDIIGKSGTLQKPLLDVLTVKVVHTALDLSQCAVDKKEHLETTAQGLRDILFKTDKTQE